MSKRKDWNEAYRQDAAPWDTGLPSQELIKLLNSGSVTPCRTLDLGCGTGTNAIYLAQKGFDVTGVDISNLAIKKAGAKAKQAGVKVRFMQAELPDAHLLSGEVFEFIFDRGCFHAIAHEKRPDFADMLARLTRKGEHFSSLVRKCQRTEGGRPADLNGKRDS